MTQIPNTPLWVEVVPIEEEPFIGTGDTPFCTNKNALALCLKDKSIALPEGKFEIVGTVTETEISFDCEPYLPKPLKGTYKNFVSGILECLTEQDSLRSLLEANGFYWVNTISKPHPVEYDLSNSAEENYLFEKRFLAWRDAESKELKPNEKLVVIKKID